MREKTIMEHLALEIFDRDASTSQFAYLPDDTSVTLTVTSELFDEGDIWSHPFQLNAEANAHIFGNSADLHGERLHEQIDRRRARLWIEGLPFYYGYLILDADTSLDADGTIDVRFESGRKTFSNLVSGAKANQVPLLSPVNIGMVHRETREALYGLSMVVDYHVEDNEESYAVPVDQDDWGWLPGPGRAGVGDVFDNPLSHQTHYVLFPIYASEGYAAHYPRMVWNDGGFKKEDGTGGVVSDWINTEHPYTDESPTAYPFCNVSVCYQKRGFPLKDGATDYGGTPEAKRGYELAPANRMNSAPCFYVMYWLRALMTHLGIRIEENQLQDIEDMRRLFFVNTRCDCLPYDELDTSAGYDNALYHCTRKSDTGTRISAIAEGRRYLKSEDSSVWVKGGSVWRGEAMERMGTYYGNRFDEEIAAIKIIVDGIKLQRWGSNSQWASDGRYCDARDYSHWEYVCDNSVFYRAYATPNCFPDVNIEEVINALRDAFGLRLVFDSEYKSVRFVLMRNIFRDNSVHDVPCNVLDGWSRDESAVRGFRMTYGQGKDDTTFYYKGFADALHTEDKLWQSEQDRHDYSHWNLDASYADLIRKVSSFDKTCSVTNNNGNAYGIKVDGDARRYFELNPSLFEFAGYADAEDGDCSTDEEKAKETVKEIRLGFTPAIMNDVNIDAEKSTGSTEQSFALFVPEEMQPRRYSPDGRDYTLPYSGYPIDMMVTHDEWKNGDGDVAPGLFKVESDAMLSSKGRFDVRFMDRRPGTNGSFKIPVYLDVEGYVREGYCLYLQDNFSPNDDGVSPLETHDWGITLGIMRGGGSDSRIKYANDYLEAEGNKNWSIIPGAHPVTHPDTCDNYGRLFDYTPNGQADAQDHEGRFSLKLRAEKPNPEFDPSLPESAENPRYLTITDPDLRGRGLADTFYPEYSYFIRNARTAKGEIQADAATLKNIGFYEHQRIGDIVGLMKKMTISVSMKNGLGKTSVEIMYI